MKVVPPVADPEAELARLRRPTGPWLHLLDAAPADARQLGWMLGQDGVVVRLLRGHCGRSRYGLLDEIGAALQLPGDPAEDWPALAALLTDMAWLPGAGHVLVVTRASLLLAAEPAGELRGLVEAVREVARGRAEEGDPVPFHVVLQDDAVGVATLRRRLDAVGAKHAELSGWDAEEPVADPVASGRSVLTGGDPAADPIDLAAGAGASEVDGLLSLGRAWEDYRGGTGTVRIYAPVLTEPRRAPYAAAAIAGAVAEQGASCVVVPVHRDAAANDPRQAAVAEAATVVWPVPEVLAAPAPATEPEPLPVAAPAAGPATGVGADAGAAPGPVSAAGWESGSGHGVSAAGAGAKAGAAPGSVSAAGWESGSGHGVSAAGAGAKAGAAPGPVSAAGWESGSGHGVSAAGAGAKAGAAPGPAAGRESGGGDGVGPVSTAGAGAGAGRVSAAGRESGSAAAAGWGSTAGTADAGTGSERGAGVAGPGERSAPVAATDPGPDAGDQPAAEDRPADRPGADFELVAADLQWRFDPGEPEPDAADAAVVAHVRSSGRTTALHRTWVRDPAGGWVRVVLGYVGPRGSIAEVEGERTAVVEALQRSGAARCCVEVLAAADAGDAHRWLEERCHPLFRRPTTTEVADRPATPTDAPPLAGAASPGPAAATGPAGTTGPTATGPVAPADPIATGPAVGVGPAVSAEAAATTGLAVGAGPAASALPDDVSLVAGPSADDAQVASLVAWAPDQPAVVALITAWAGAAADRTLLVGVAVDAAADPDPLAAAAGGRVAGRVVVFSPARRLSPLQLRLTRTGTRVWQRRTERAAPAPQRRGSAGELSRPDAPKVVALGPIPVRDTEEPRADVDLGGFVLVGIDRQTPIGKGAPAPDDRDAAVVAWARHEPATIALLRAVATEAGPAGAEEAFPVYCACVTPEADPEAVRRRLAAAVAATGTARAAAEAFAPAGVISAFHLDLAVGSTRLWPVTS